MLLVAAFHMGVSQSKELVGYITDRGAPIHGAHIYNHNTKTLTITQPDGTFAIPVDLEDSIQISHVGFVAIDLKVDSLLVSEKLYISLKPNAIQLEEVQVSFPTYTGFKDQLLATDPVDSSHLVYGLDQVDFSQVSFPEEPSTEDPETALTTGGVGARFDLEGLTRRGKEKKKYRKLKEQETLRSKADQKFDRDWVSEVTKLQGDQLTDFIAFCNFSPEYLVETPIYIIQEDMLALLEKFQAGNDQSEEDRHSPGS